ncbi:MAG TPA: acyl-ACP--UDP-N-acetylglucosamine O-acyltransferase [Chromatiaceae bacterium]|nr:acyl-ACP--UDP-N-acetylglucosamine O-acyltransferase [Chromatiaceae bacterium]
MIDPRALVDSKAELDEDVSVGPFAIIEADVRIGRGSSIGPHSIVRAGTRMGRDNRVFQYASVGEDPQDKKYNGEPTELILGDRNVVREFATLNRGTAQDSGATRIGSDNLLMAYIHVAHDCQIGDHTIMANAASLGGHVHIDDYAILGGFTIVHQFCRVGAHSFSQMGSMVQKDIPPFVTVGGHPAKSRGINAEGLKRRDFPLETISAIKRAYRKLFMSGLRLEDALSLVSEEMADIAEVNQLVEFISSSQRSVIR